jgi:hypothetical protein
MAEANISVLYLFVIYCMTVPVVRRRSVGLLRRLVNAEGSSQISFEILSHQLVGGTEGNPVRIARLYGKVRKQDPLIHRRVSNRSTATASYFTNDLIIRRHTIWRTETLLKLTQIDTQGGTQTALLTVLKRCRPQQTGEIQQTLTCCYCKATGDIFWTFTDNSFENFQDTQAGTQPLMKRNIGGICRWWLAVLQASWGTSHVQCRCQFGVRYGSPVITSVATCL